MRTILIASILASLAHAGCIAVPSNRILARDIGDALPYLKGLDPETVIGFAPLPGVQRILSARELTLIARQHGLNPDGSTVSSICVERVMRPISSQEMTAALLSAIGTTDVELELIEYSSQPLPPGQLEFKPDHLGRPLGENPKIAVIWRGLLRYDGQASIAVWAKVRVSVGCALLVAAEDVPAGSVIRASQIKEVQGRQFPFASFPIQTSEAIIGKIARRNIPVGQRFASSGLEELTAISQGDIVRVKVVDGSATLLLEAVAQSSGKRGESILLHNPSTGKNFRAVVEEKGRATVRSSPGA